MSRTTSLPSVAGGLKKVRENRKPVGPVWPTFKRLIGVYLRPRLGTVLLAVAMMGVSAAMTGAFVWILEPTFDRIFMEGDRTLVAPLAGGVFAIFLVAGAATFGSNVLLASITRGIIAVLRQQMFNQVIRADLAWVHSEGTSRIVSRFVYDVQQVALALTGTIVTFGRQLLTLVALTIVMFLNDAILALIAAAAIPLGVLPVILIGRKSRRISRETQNQFGTLTSNLTQKFQALRHVKAYNAEEREIRTSHRIIDRIAKLQQRMIRTRNSAQPIMDALTGAVLCGILLYGGYEVIDGSRTQGQLFSFIAALLLAYQPLKALANANVELQVGLAAAERVFTMMDTPPRIVDAPDAVDIGRSRGAIRLEDVTFHYGDDRLPALNGVTIDIEPGTKVALVGPSGAGKSTVLNIIPRFYDVTSGRVTLDGVDQRRISLASLRANLALVSQDVMLFDDTVRANILFARPEASEEELVAAARAAAAHEFISELPRGYDTQVGENGVLLSGGQRQRIAIARAMLKDAPILLLDEATSALDTANERAVQAALEQLSEGRTTVVIAHRLSTIADADRIYVLEGGRVAEAGDHAELLARGGLYARLWAMQTLA